MIVVHIMRYWAAEESVVASRDGSASGVHGDGVLSVRTHRMPFLICDCIVTSPFSPESAVRLLAVRMRARPSHDSCMISRIGSVDLSLIQGTVSEEATKARCILKIPVPVRCAASALLQVNTKERGGT